MAYLSLYRKYRPQKFADVAGQDHVVQTLQNALIQGRIAHGYLFCGTRGVAKTTIARVLAKCLNCVGPDGSRTTPAPEPCNECAPCRAISAGQCVDVVEMDAASNRSVADIGKLREGVQFGPMECRYKTYIVDEAHQLSSDAKDAFLKTLEEPPANVVFILATTEAHAIPVTIASRCQHFEFKRGSIAQIARRLTDVLALEEVSMPAEAVLLIARCAEGSWRDSLSLLEQVLAYKRDGITAHNVAEVLGTVQGDVLDGVVDSIAMSDAAGAFATAEQVFTGGKDVRQFLKALSARLRDLLFVRVGASASPEDAGAVENPALLGEQAARFTPAALLKGLEVLAEAEREIRFANQHRLLLELALLRLMDLSGSPSPISEQAITRTPAPPPAASAAPATPVRAKRTLPETPDMAEEVGDEEEEILNAVPEREEPRDPSESDLGRLLAEPTETAPVGPAHEPADALSLLQKKWQEVIHHMQTKSASGAQVIKDARPIELTGHTFTLAFSRKANLDMMDNARRRAFVEEIINKTLRAKAGAYRIKGVLQEGERPQAPANRLTAKGADNAPAAAAPLDLDEGDSELLDEVIAVFGGKIIEDR